ncbi:uncharacterized protein LOC135107595 isoform X1 [Scylla paramamosain]|uniref:uncharacterized protein LOC135107595 isoform X1 n=1 Tax=Scylla paramamosain TaxID=85552 RepID=UPI00308355AF
MAGRVGCRSSLLLLLLLLHVTVNVRQAGGEQQPHFLHQQRALNMSVQRGSTAYLHCRVADLQDQSVSWYRKRGDEIQLITFDFQTYHNDDRFALSYEQPHNWRLRIRYVQERDEGSYRCQVGTHPPLALTVRLQVVEAAVHILDERGVMLREKFYRVGSTIELQCRVADVPTATTLQLAWYRNRHRLNYDDVRGGVRPMSFLRVVAQAFLWQREDRTARVLGSLVAPGGQRDPPRLGLLLLQRDWSGRSLCHCPRGARRVSCCHPARSEVGGSVARCAPAAGFPGLYPHSHSASRPLLLHSRPQITLTRTTDDSGYD